VVTLTYNGFALKDYDILIEMDTAALITAGKMQPDCDDLRVDGSGRVRKVDDTN